MPSSAARGVARTAWAVDPVALPTGRVYTLPRRPRLVPEIYHQAEFSGAGNTGWVQSTGPLMWDSSVKAIALAAFAFERAINEMRLGSSTGPVIPIVASYVRGYIGWFTDMGRIEPPMSVWINASGFMWCLAVTVLALRHPSPLFVQSVASGADASTLTLSEDHEGESLTIGATGEGPPTLGADQVMMTGASASTGRYVATYRDSVSPTSVYAVSSGRPIGHVAALIAPYVPTPVP